MNARRTWIGATAWGATAWIGATAAIFLLAGCTANDRTPQDSTPKAATPGTNDESTATPAAPMQVDGFQVVRVIVRDEGYTPDRIQLAAGKPAKIVFVQESDSHCASQIQIPAFDVPVTDLPVGRETVVEFTPKEAGDYEFTCGMNMLRGTITVGS